MAYALYDKEGVEVTHHDLQDKTQWCKNGEKVEQSFVRIHGSGLNISINPDKDTNPYSPDLLNLSNGIRVTSKPRILHSLKHKHYTGLTLPMLWCLI